jgi:CDP-6-deoxy-D-xylo-4-hexulose-3-dehydrase
MIQLVKDTIDNKDIDQLVDWLKTYPRLTKGNLTLELEKKFAEWVGTKYAVFVNSGSSANLLMLYALKCCLDKQLKIMVSSLCWATDLAPIMQLGMKPILIDCNLEDLSIDLTKLEQEIIYNKPDALLLVSVLGLSPNMDKIVDICNKHNVILLEDNCESQGTRFAGKKLGTFGEMATFSTYFGHIMSTIEGGFITTNNVGVYETLISLRSHGWDRELSEDTQQILRKTWGISDFNSLYTFYFPGFNVRPTDLNAFIGLKQMEKVDKAIEKRNENFQMFKILLEGKTWFPKEQKNSYTASFCIPVIFKSKENKENAIKEFKEKEIEVRPIIAGSMGKQPFYVGKYGEKNFPNCDIIDERGIYVPNHPLLTVREIRHICEIIIKNDK